MVWQSGSLHCRLSSYFRGTVMMMMMVKWGTHSAPYSITQQHPYRRPVFHGVVWGSEYNPVRRRHSSINVLYSPSRCNLDNCCAYEPLCSVYSCIVQKQNVGSGWNSNIHPTSLAHPTFVAQSTRRHKQTTTISFKRLQ